LIGRAVSPFRSNAALGSWITDGLERGGAFSDLKARPDLTSVLGTVGERIEGMFSEL